MRTVAVIQARMGASRLPGKVMKRLGERSVLAHVIERVVRCRGLDAVVVATTLSPQDDQIANEATHCGVSSYRGSEHDVLARYYGAALQERAGIVVRVTADCPFLDTEVLENLLAAFVASQESARPCDYLSNTLERTYPRGLDAEIFSFSVLQQAHNEAKLPYEREHVTPYLYQHPARFHLCSQRNDTDLSTHRWTLDTEEDWRFIQAVHQALVESNQAVRTKEILAVLKANPGLLSINAHIEQKKLDQ